MARAFVGFVLLASTLGCGFDFDRPSEVIDRRILAISIDPPELTATRLMSPVRTL